MAYNIAEDFEKELQEILGDLELDKQMQILQELQKAYVMGQIEGIQLGLKKLDELQKEIRKYKDRIY